jgi:hypothetical protein
MGFSVFFPKQLQCYVLVPAQLLVEGGKVRLLPYGLPDTLRAPVQGAFQIAVVGFGRHRPTYARRFCTLQVLMNRADCDRATPGNLPLIELQFKSES